MGMLLRRHHELKDTVTHDEVDYENMTVTELKELAKDRNIDFKDMKKAELIDALRG